MPYKIRVTGLLNEGQWNPDVESDDPAAVQAVLQRKAHIPKMWGHPERRIPVAKLLERYPEGELLLNDDDLPVAVRWNDPETGELHSVLIEDVLPGWEWAAYDGTPHPIRYDEAADELVSDAQHVAVVEDVTDERAAERRAEAKRQILNDPELLDDLLELLPAAQRQKYRDRIDVGRGPQS